MLEPLNDLILIRRAATSNRTAGGIVLSESAQDKPSQGEVIAVGQGGRSKSGERIAPRVAVGDWVLFAKWKYDEIEHEGEKLLLVKEDNILAVVQ